MPSIKVGCRNVAGLDGKDDDLVLLMTELGLSFMFVCETWGRAGSLPPANDAILYWGPSTVRNNMGHFPYGVALLAGPEANRKAVKVIEGIRGHSVLWSYMDKSHNDYYFDVIVIINQHVVRL